MANIGVIASSWKASTKGLIGVYTVSGYSVENTGSVLDSTNMYLVGQTNNSWETMWIKAALSNFAVSSAYTGTNNNASAGIATTNGSNYAFAGTRTGPRSDLFVVNNTFGGISEQNAGFSGSTYDTSSNGALTATSSDFFVGGWIDGTGNGYLCKWSGTSFQPTWARKLTYSTNFSYVIGVSCDNSTGESVALGRIQTSPQRGEAQIFNSSGTNTAGFSIYAGASTVTELQCGIDQATSGNLFVAGGYTDTGAIIVGFKTSGGVQWQRRFTSTISGFIALTKDSSDNIYGLAYGNANNAVYIVKYNSSGTLQWQRSLTVNTGNLSAAGKIRIDGSGNFIASGWVSGSPNKTWVLKMPTDGSGGGTASAGGLSWTYATSTASESAGVLTVINGGIWSAATLSTSPTAQGTTYTSRTATVSSSAI